MMRVSLPSVAAGVGAVRVLAGCAAVGAPGARSGDPATAADRTSTASVGPSTSTCSVPARCRGQELSRQPVTAKVIALTFDAGANADGVRQQVREAESKILSTTGQDPRGFIRFPFGATNAHPVGLVNSLRYVPFRWSVDILGWKGTSGGMTAAEVVDRVLDAAAPGAIVLMHVGPNPDDGGTLDADALPADIDGLRARGYTLVPLSRVMSAAP